MSELVAQIERVEHQYEHLLPYEWLSPDDLDLLLCEARKDPAHTRRRAHIALELAQHPVLDDSERQPYLAEANDVYDLIMDTPSPANVLELSDNMNYTFLPLLGSHTKTSAKAARKEVRERSLLYTNKIVRHQQHSPEVARGAAAELVAATVLRQQGYCVQPSMPRQDNSRMPVDGQRYAWDVSAASEPPVDVDPGDLLRIQVKHRDFNSRKITYHPDIIVHRVFPPDEHFNAADPQVFHLLYTALGVDEESDPKAYRKYTERLLKDLP